MRIAFSLILVLSIITLPAWVYIPLGVVGVVLFPLYIEAIIFGALVDTLYGVSGGFVSGFLFAWLSGGLVFFAQPLREQLRFNV